MPARFSRRFPIYCAWALCMISCGGCNIQASNVADHLDMMATIAIRNMGNCETMSDALNAYLDEHGDAIQKSACSIVSANVEDVRGMFQSTTRIDMAIEHCPPTTMHRFRYRMAEILFEEPKKQ